jgi:hypothetical protein
MRTVVVPPRGRGEAAATAASQPPRSSPNEALRAPRRSAGPIPSAPALCRGRALRGIRRRRRWRTAATSPDRRPRGERAAGARPVACGGAARAERVAVDARRGARGVGEVCRAANVPDGAASRAGAAGASIEQSYDVEVGPDGALYVVDYSVVNVNPTVPNRPPYAFLPRTGAAWRATRAPWGAWADAPRTNAPRGPRQRAAPEAPRVTARRGRPRCERRTRGECYARRCSHKARSRTATPQGRMVAHTSCGRPEPPSTRALTPTFSREKTNDQLCAQ